MCEGLSVKGGRDGGHQCGCKASQCSEAGLRVGVMARLGRLAVGVRVHDPLAVDEVRMVEKRRRGCISHEKDQQPTSQSSSYFLSTTGHAQSLCDEIRSKRVPIRGAKKCTQNKSDNPPE